MKVDEARRITGEESRGSLALLFGVLGAPVAWSGHLAVNYALEEWFACASSAPEPGLVLGLPVDTVSLAFNSLMAATALAAVLVALHCWRRLRSDDGDERMQRARWMAFAGVVESALFLVIILLGFAPPLMLGTCEYLP
ncbi:MAG: hypothetical protein M3N52_11595 [Actinomycetota bacterium]|nr:hypothetical protein [Actinomycetota bacterium]